MHADGDRVIRQTAALPRLEIEHRTVEHPGVDASVDAVHAVVAADADRYQPLRHRGHDRIALARCGRHRVDERTHLRRFGTDRVTHEWGRGQVAVVDLALPAAWCS